MVKPAKVTVTLKEQFNNRFNDIFTGFLQNRIKVADYFKNYGVFFVEFDKNNAKQLNYIHNIQKFADIEDIAK